MNLKKARFVWKLARRDITENRKISVIVVVMLSFSFINLVFFPAFISGLSHSFTEGLIEGQTGHVSIEAEEGRLQNPDAIAEKVSRMKGVRLAEKVLEARATAYYGGETAHIVVKGTDAQGFEGYTSKIQAGGFLKKDSEEVVIGRFLAGEKEKSGVQGLGLEPGNVFVLRGDSFSRQVKVRGVIGTKGGIAGMSKKIYVSYDAAEEMFNAEGEADRIKIILKDRTDSDSFKDRLQKLNTEGEIRTWREQSNMAEGITGTFGIVIDVLSIVGLIVALAAIGVVIFINTSKRIREMGVVRAIGAEQQRVIEIFVLEAFLFGVAGIIIGNMLTLGINAALTSRPIMSPVGPISTRISSDLLMTRSAWMAAASVVAGFIPAYMASKTEIIETIENR